MKAHIITFGCRQNENDSEKIMGVLESLGYTSTDDIATADLVLFNTCAVREHGEHRVYGNVGAMRKMKKDNPNLILGVCGCMMRQQHVAQKIKKSYPYVDIVFGTNSIHKLPEILYAAKSRRVFELEEDDIIHEEIPTSHAGGVIANVPIMYGCNNFCTYCVVPYVRGRERSREKQDILREIEGLVVQGVREVLLLGQNVNSYPGFAKLLEAVSEIPNLHRIRFISSHPKDFASDTMEVMAAKSNICNQLHLPFQSGSNKILKDMNRRYTREDYIEQIQRFREKIPNAAITSDVIVGFPTETNDDFEDTLSLIKEIEFDMLFSFIYSKRKGTVAEKMAPVMTEPEIKRNFDRLLEAQAEISLKKNLTLHNTTQKILVEGESKTNPEFICGRTDGGKIVNFAGNLNLIGELIDVKIIETKTWSLKGEILL